MNKNLPSSWLLTELSKAVIYNKGKKPLTLTPNQSKDLVPYINIKAFEKGIIDEYADIKSSRLINENDILVVWDGARFGLTGIGMNGAAGSTLMVLKPIVCESKFIYFFINRYYEYINSKPKGTGTPHVNPDIFWNLPFPIAPLNEQRRIVAKLDAVMPRIEAIKERLNKVPTILKRFRQSVLTAAVTGKLTEQWREKHPDIESANMLLKKIKTVKNNVIKRFPYSLPDEWLIVGFYDVATIKSNLVTPSNYLTYPHIAPDNIERETGKLLSYNTIKEDKVTSPKHLFNSGQIIYSKIRPYLSKAILVDFDGLCSADMYPIESKINSKYLLYSILENAFLDFASTAGTRSVLPKINQKELGQIPIPLPPLEEQKEIVHQVDKLFALADKVEAHYQKAKERVDKLSQSVLAKAFRGELVPQDPNDEPAEKLLERILQEKASLEKKPKTSKKRGSKK